MCVFVSVQETFLHTFPTCPQIAGAQAAKDFHDVPDRPREFHGRVEPIWIPHTIPWAEQGAALLGALLITEKLPHQLGRLRKRSRVGFNAKHIQCWQQVGCQYVGNEWVNPGTTLANAGRAWQTMKNTRC